MFFGIVEGEKFQQRGLAYGLGYLWSTGDARLLCQSGTQLSRGDSMPCEEQLPQELGTLCLFCQRSIELLQRDTLLV